MTHFNWCSFGKLFYFTCLLFCKKKKMKLYVSILTIFFSVIAANAQADSINYFRKAIDSYYYSFDKEKLESIHNDLLRFREKHEDSIDICKYYTAILHINLGKIYYNIDSDIAYNHFDFALSALREIETHEKDAEYMALISCAYGKKSSLSTFQAIFFGMAAKNSIVDAYEIDTNSIHVLLIAATHLMHTPETFGGDKKQARKLLRQCLKLNKDRDSSEARINWASNAEIYAYVAQLAILEEKKEEAEKYMKKALALQPDYGFVLVDLKAQLEKIED
jgi:tetratricopeptide (TPR) repeat protein